MAITLNNTKQEIFDAYTKAIEDNEELSAKEILIEAKNIVEKKFPNRIGIAQLLTRLSDKV